MPEDFVVLCLSLRLIAWFLIKGLWENDLSAVQLCTVHSKSCLIKVASQHCTLHISSSLLRLSFALGFSSKCS